jgi:hypothetical protein
MPREAAGSRHGRHQPSAEPLGEHQPLQQPHPPILLRGTGEGKLPSSATTASSNELGLQRRGQLFSRAAAPASQAQNPTVHRPAIAQLATG